MVRDILINDVPVVLRSDLYAVPALAGATVVVIGNALSLPSAATSIVGASSVSRCAFWQFALAGGFPSPVENEMRTDCER
jgi:uncharacterized membrane protein YeiH